MDGMIFSPGLKNRMAKAAKRKSSKRKSSGTTKKNKLGVKNSLVNNINAKKKMGTSHTKKESSVSKEAYDKMENDWKN